MFQQIYQNFTFDPPHTQACVVQKLEVFSTLKEVAGYINIQAHHPRFTTLSAFSNLEIVGVRHF